MINYLQKFRKGEQNKLLAMAVFLLLSLGMSAQGFLNNSTSTSLTAGVTITEVAGFGGPSWDWDCNGSIDNAADEFTEITNTSGDTVDISNWKVGDGGNYFIIPSGTILGPGKRLVIFQNTSGATSGGLLGTGPSSFNAGDSNYCYTWNTGISNSSDAVGLRNKDNRYIGVKFGGGSIGSNITSGATLVGTTTNNPTSSGNTCYRVNYTSSTWNTHPTISKTVNWSTASVTLGNFRGSPGRDSTGQQMTPPAPSSTPTISFGTATSTTIPITALNNTGRNCRRIIVVKADTGVTFTPTDTVSYSGVNANFGTATNQGSGNKIVYDGFATSNPVTVTGLSSSTKYAFKVFEYNGKSPASDISYRTTTVAKDTLSTTASVNPSVNVSVNSSSGTEAAATVITVTATASSAVTGDQTVNIGVSGTGITAGDYSLSNTTITILSGNTTGTVTFTIVNDTIGEGTETAVLTISSPSSGIILGSTVFQNVNITDDEPTVSISTSASSGTEGDSIIVTATLSSSVATQQTVNVGVSGTNVTSGDYSFANATITIAANSTTGTTKLYITDDNIREATETFVAGLTSTSARISLGGTTTSNISVTDNDDQLVLNQLNHNSAVEDFNTLLANSGSQCPRGWYFEEAGSSANTLYDSTSGNPSNGNTYSCGDYNNSERSFGSLNTSNLTSIYLGVNVKNNTGGILTHLNISYVGEQWRSGSTGVDKLACQYSLNATGVNDVSATWTSVSSLDFNAPILTGSGALNGNAFGNRTTFSNITFQLASTLSNGSSAWIRFVDQDISGSDQIMAIDSFVVTPLNLTPVNYYLGSSGDCNNTSSWWTNNNSTGTHPNNFTDSLQHFIIMNQSNATLSGAWTVSGNQSYVILGDSINNISFTIPSSNAFTGSIDVKYKGNLVMQNTSMPTLGTIENGSTIEYAQSSGVTVLNSINYYNLTLSNSGVKTISAGTTTVNGNFLANNTALAYPASTATLSLGGNYTLSGTVTQSDTTRGWAINTNSSSNQTISGNGNSAYINRLTCTKTNSNLTLNNVRLVELDDIRFLFTGTAKFNDGGNTIVVGDDVVMGGVDSAYILTGTIEIKNQQASSANLQADATLGGAIVAHLNNLILNTGNSNNPAVLFDGTGNDIYINGDFSIISSTNGNVSLQANTYHIKGNYTNLRNANIISSSTSTIIFEGSSTQNISIAYTSGETLNNVTINNSNGLNLTGKISVKGVLNVNNNIITNSNSSSRVILTSTGSISRGTGYINGILQKNIASGSNISSTFEIGNATKYLPVNITFASVTTGGNLALSSTATNESNISSVCIDAGKTIKRYWTFENNGIIYSTYNTTVAYAGADTTSGGANTNALTAAVYKAAWFTANIASHTDSTVTLNNIDSLGDLQLGEQRVLTSTFVSSANNACQNVNMTITYMGNGSNVATYNWNFAGATIVSGSGKGPYTIKWTTTGTKNIKLVVSENGCISDTGNLSIIVSQNGWTGSIDKAWDKAGNWCTNVVPTYTSTVYIPAGVSNMPTIAGTQSCKTLTIASGATLTIVTGGSLTIDSTYARNGQLDHIGGYLILKFPQVLPADTHAVLTLNGSGTYTLGGNVQINNLITISAGVTLNDGGKTITIIKDIVNNGTHSGTGKMVFAGAASQTISGTSNIYKNIELTSANGLRTANDMTVLGSLGLNPGSLTYKGTNLTIGGVNNTDSNKIYGTGWLMNSGSTGTLTILGDTGAARLEGLRVQTKAPIFISRAKGVKLGGDMTQENQLNLSLGTLDMNGYSATIGTTGTATCNIVTSGGSLTNSASSGQLSINGNNGCSAINNLKLGSQFRVSVSFPKGITLGQGCDVSNLFIITNGFVNLNGYTVTLGNNANINEAPGQTFRGSSGSVQISKTYTTALSGINPGGLGLVLSTNNNPGTVTISRSHNYFTNGGSGKSIKRSYYISASNNSGLIASNLLLNYDSTELNGANRNYLRLNSSTNGGSTWSTVGPTNRTTGNAAIGYAGSYNVSLSSSKQFTLSDSLNSPLRVLQSIEPTAQTKLDSKIYPVPFDDNLNIQIDGIANISIYDMEGKLVISSKANGLTQLNTSILPYGIYMLRIDSNEGSSVHKIVKQ